MLLSSFKLTKKSPQKKKKEYSSKFNPISIFPTIFKQTTFLNSIATGSTPNPSAFFLNFAKKTHKSASKNWPIIAKDTTTLSFFSLMAYKPYQSYKNWISFTEISNHRTFSLKMIVSKSLILASPESTLKEIPKQIISVTNWEDLLNFPLVCIQPKVIYGHWLFMCSIYWKTRSLSTKGQSWWSSITQIKWKKWYLQRNYRSTFNLQEEGRRMCCHFCIWFYQKW